MTKPPVELLDFLHRYDTGVQSLALGLRRVVHEELAGCHEYIFDMRSKLVLVYGATEHVIADGICIIGVNARHVTLMFHRGIDLDDAAGLLQGRGKAMRHLKLTRLSDLDRREIRAFLRQARKLAGLKRRRDQTAAEVVTKVKPKSTPKPTAWPRTGW